MAKVIQITDCHLGETPEEVIRGCLVAGQLQQVVTHALAHHPDAELVLATGDLVHETLNVEPYQWLHQQLSKITPNIAYLPGNHDCWATMRRALPENTTRAFRLFHHWQVITLNTNIPVWEPDGRLGTAQLAWLDGVLTALPDKPALIALHHHAIKMAEWMEDVRLLDRDEFWQVIRRHPQVKGICWGHVHQAYDQELAGLRLMATPATSMQFSHTSNSFAIDDDMPFGYRVIELTDSLESEVYRVSTTY